MNGRILGQSLPNTIRQIKDGQERFSISPITFKGDWAEFHEPMEYVSATSMAVVNTEVDLTKTFSIGTPIRYKQGGNYKYGYVQSVTANALVVNAGTDYTILNTDITDLAKGFNVTAVGFPGLFKFAPNITGLGATYTQVGTPDYYFSMNGRLVTILASDLNGSSVNGSCALYWTLPIPAETIAPFFFVLLNGTRTVGLGYVANGLIGPTPAQNYGYYFKNVNEDPIILGGTNHYTNFTYICEG